MIRVSSAQQFRLACLTLSVFILASLAYGQATVSLTPGGGPPTSNVEVSGSGYTPYAQINIYFDVKQQGLAIADGTGSFSNVKIEAPRTAAPGKHWVSAVQQEGLTGAQAPFWVHTDWNQLGFDPAHTQNNIYENQLNRRTVKQLKLDWSYPSASGSPIVVKDQIYFGSGNSVYALGGSNGNLLWQYTSGGTVASPPAFAQGSVFFGSGDFNIYALNAKSGTLEWKYATGSYVVSSPLVVNGVVYVASDDNDVYALNESDGTLLWKYATTAPVQFAPSFSNGVVYVPSSDGTIYALNAADGSLDWKFMTTPTNNSSTPSVANGVVYVASADANIYALNASNGTLLWKTPVQAPADGSTAAVADGMVFVGSGDAGIFYALSANTGSVRWKFKSTGAPVYSASAVANGVVYVGSGDQNFYALDTSSGAVLWKYTTAGYFPSAAVTNGRVYLSGDKFYVFKLPGEDAAPKAPGLGTLGSGTAVRGGTTTS